MYDFVVVFFAKYLYLLPVAIFVGYGFFTHRKKDFFLFALVVLPVSFILSRIAGHLFYDPRPFIDSSIIPLIKHVPDNGFPSDHALLTGTLASIISVFSAPLGALLWVFAILVGGARVLAHVHHTLDIVGSYLIAIISILVFYPFLESARTVFSRVLKYLNIEIN